MVRGARLGLLLAMGWLSLAWAAGGKVMSVQVREGQLRSGASFLSPVVRAVPYGERLTIGETRGVWLKASTADGAATGWIHTSALTEKKLKVQAGGGDAPVAASSGELGLAGKGFSADVEKAFKAGHKDISFAWVDRMEQWKVPAKEAQVFLKAGSVTPREGGAQ